MTPPPRTRQPPRRATARSSVRRGDPARLPPGTPNPYWELGPPGPLTSSGSWAPQQDPKPRKGAGPPSRTPNPFRGLGPPAEPQTPTGGWAPQQNPKPRQGAGPPSRTPNPFR
ncbi:hypothetical protein B484DRAFT_338172, partial [Ochromonadaceae sp. CCMP2298]